MKKGKWIRAAGTVGAAAIKHHKNKNEDSGEAASGKWIKSGVELELCLFLYVGAVLGKILLYSAVYLASPDHSTVQHHQQPIENETSTR